MRIALVGFGFLASALLVLFIRLTPPALPVPARSDAVIAGVTVIQPGVERLPDHSIVIRDGRIAAVRPRRPEDPAPLCPGCYALPGLIDAHVHTPPRIAIGNQQLFTLLYLAHGVTTIRDVGASDGSVAALAARLNEGRVVGPHMLRCGPVLDGDPPGWPVATVVTSAHQGAELVDQLADDGVDCIKVYNELGREAFDAIAVAAQRRGLPVIGHVPHAVGLGGVTAFEAQHLTGVPYLSRPRPPLGWDVRDADVLALSDADADRAFALAMARRVTFTPTLANFTLRLSASDPQRFPPSPASTLLPEYWAAAWSVIAGHPSTDAEIERRLRSVPAMRALVGRARALGIDILAGTDTIMPWVVPGESLHLEIAELAEALGSAEAALASATTVNGRHLGSGEIGVIAPGARADILVSSDDPTDRLAALRDWRFVFADGRRYERATVDGWVEDYRSHFRTGAQSAVVGRIVDWAIDGFENRAGEPSEPDQDGPGWLPSTAGPRPTLGAGDTADGAAGVRVARGERAPPGARARRRFAAAAPAPSWHSARAHEQPNRRRRP